MCESALPRFFPHAPTRRRLIPDVHHCALWKSYGWRRTPTKGAVANLDLMIRLDAALQATGPVHVAYYKHKRPCKVSPV